MGNLGGGVRLGMQMVEFDGSINYNAQPNGRANAKPEKIGCAQQTLLTNASVGSLVGHTTR